LKRLFWIGIVVLLAGFILLGAGSSGQGSVSSGGVIFIGPFPFAFGSGPEGWQLALASVVIGGVMIVLLFLWSWRFSRMRQA
jgi:uncharacterized membrane protein